MGTRSHHQSKSAPEPTTAAPQNTLQPRPFAPQAESVPTLEDVQSQLEHTQRFGHHLSNFAASQPEPPPPGIQPKLTIGAPGDKYEQEADRVAQQVVQRIHMPKPAAPPLDSTQPTSAVQRESIPMQHDSQLKPLLQREEVTEEDELQMKPMQRKTAAGSIGASTDLENSIQQSRGSGQSLADSIRQPMERAFGGVDFSGVKVHTDAQADQLNRSIQAKAFTTGQDVFFRQDAYQPGSSEGQELIAHELTHVVQQNGSAVQRSPIASDQNIDSDALIQRIDELQPIKLGRRIQRNWDTSGQEPVYRDDQRGVTWHLTPNQELWYETDQESSPYKGYAGIEHKGTYAKWFMLGSAPFELIKEQASTIEIPKQDQLPPEFHEAYQLYVYIIRISTLKWDDIVKKPPFSKFGWKARKIYEHYKKHVNPLIEKEDSGLNAYYGPFYKRMNPFLRAIQAEFGDEKYDEIIEGNFGKSDEAKLIELLDKESKKAGFNSDIDEVTLREVLAEIRGAKREIKKNSEITQISKQIPTVYRGDSERTVDRLAKTCGFDKTKLDSDGQLSVGKPYTQRQFVSTTDQRKIGPPAATGTLWNINLGEKAKATTGGLYVAESEVLFPPQTTFLIERIETINQYDGSGAIGDQNTKYIIYAHQG